MLGRTVKKPTLAEALAKKQNKEICVADQVSQNTDLKIKLSKMDSLKILSQYICDSGIITYEDPDRDPSQLSGTIEDEVFRNNTTQNIEKEIISDGRSMPVVKKDAELNNRNFLMNIWRETENKCNVICDDLQTHQTLSKIYYIDASAFKSRQSAITTIADNPAAVAEAIAKKTNYVSAVPIMPLSAVYSNNNYNTKIRLLNSNPVFESKIRLKSVYICAGSSMVQGGNADQGLSVTESTLYLTTTYSIALTKALHCYPLLKHHILVCPNVLVFKDLQYKSLTMQEYKRISVICAPSSWRPRIVNKTNNDTPIDLYDTNTKYENRDVYNDVKQHLSNVFEVALYRGYDTIILDDRGICDNLLPCHETVIIVRDVINMFRGRFEEVIIAISNNTIYNIYKQYIHS